jgi:hypothetical protein
MGDLAVATPLRVLTISDGQFPWTFPGLSQESEIQTNQKGHDWFTIPPIMTLVKSLWGRITLFGTGAE